MNLLLFLALLVLAGIIIFILQNPAVVVVKFIIWQTQAIPLGLVVLMATCTTQIGRASCRERV